MSEAEEKLAKFKEEAVTQLTEVGEADVDDALISTLVDNLKLVINNRDALYVAGTDPAELETVKRNFVAKKLGINDDSTAMGAINGVVEKMSGIRMKNRAAFYYLVQKALT